MLQGMHFSESYALVCDQDTGEVLFVTAALKNLLMHMDVKTAFLNRELTDLTYCGPSLGYGGEKGMVCKVNKALYVVSMGALAQYSQDYVLD